MAVIRTNAMKCITNYFPKASLEKIFFCFADPHFKAKNHRRRVINRNSLSEYAYIMKTGAILYCITDVEELHNWQVKHLDEHPVSQRAAYSDAATGQPTHCLTHGNAQSFERLTEEELKGDLAYDLIQNSSEESIKVSRNAGSKWSAAYRRISLETAKKKLGME